MKRRTQVAPRRLPDDLLEGFERRFRATDIPAAKLPEILQLRAIGLQVMAHVAAIETELDERDAVS